MPRNVNTICFNSLTLAYALAKREAGTDEIAEALRDLNLTVGGAEPKLQTAGGSIDLFTRGAIDMIVAASGGMPRNVNTICFNSLTLAYALAKREAGTDEIAEALRDLNLTVGGAEPKPSRTTLELPLAFGQTAQSFRPAWIAGCLALLAACTFLLGRF